MSSRLLPRGPLYPILLLVVLAAACGGSPTASDLPSPELRIGEVLDLLVGLRERGIELQFVETIDAPIFPVLTDRYRRRDDELRLYGFTSVEDAEETVADLSSDGRSLADEPLALPDDPIRFYHDRRLIVLHIGGDAELDFALRELTGGQVAGD